MMTRKSLIKTLAILAAFSLLVLLSLWSVKSNDNQVANIRIGAVLPLTGKFASISEDIQHALTLAEETSGSVATVIYEDSAGDSQKGISAITNLIHNKKVNAVLTGPGSTVNISMAPVAEKSKVVFMAITSTPQLMRKDDFTFTLQPEITKEVSKAVELSKKLGSKRVAVMYDLTSDTLTLAAEEFENGYGSHAKVTKEGYGKDIDYKTIVTKAIGQKPDLIYILAVDKIAGPIVKQIRELGYDGNIIGFSGAQSQEFLSSAQSRGEGFIVTSVPFSCDSNEETIKYCQLYRTKFNREPQQYGAYAYDTYMHIIKAFASCPASSGDMARSCITRYKSESPTLTKSFAFDANGDLSQDVPIDLRVVKGGKFVDFE